MKEAEQLSDWVMHYYEKPEPEQVPSEFIQMNKAGFLDRPDSQFIFITFLSELMNRNPDRIATWVNQLQEFSQPQKRLLWAAAWQSRTDQGTALLKKLSESLTGEDKEYVLALLARKAEPFDQKPIQSPGALDLLWACFFASGDERYVNRVIDALKLSEGHGGDILIGAAASFSLGSNARTHPKVMKICLEAQRARPELSNELGKVIENANGTDK
ncbi:MAG: hypothetical protein SGJ27_13535 [Candidatus Melainabacteria bacterium]|nr:hypothetical protein [Candidatus Melainabacteria bacterium]